MRKVWALGGSIGTNSDWSIFESGYNTEFLESLSESEEKVKLE